MRRLLGRIAFVASLAAGIGCRGEGGGALPEVLAGGAADDGTGFVELADGADVALVPGAQGGFHVWINVRVHGVEGRVALVREARRATDDVLVLRGARQPLEIPAEAMEGWWESPKAAPSFMCPTPVGVRIADEPIRFLVEIEDSEGQPLGADELVVTPRCPSGEQRAFCLQICTG